MREFVGAGLDVEAVEAPLANGFISAAGTVAVATEEDFFGSRRHTRTAPRFTTRRNDAIADELEPGDFAVHRIHGVGRYAGITHRALAGAERDYLILEYAQGDKLFVPSDQVGMVARYLGGDAPRLHRLGGSDWVKATTKVKRAVKDMAGELVRLYSVRMSVEGHTFGPDTPWQHELEDAFPHDETGDQLTAIEDVKHDMQLPKPMDRLICGDVGFGKTEVAIRAAFKAVMEGKQVAVLVPTTLLAEQHFISFSERYAPFPVKVAMLSRFVSAADQKKVIADAAKGAVDVVIGTHRILSSDVTFKDLGLVIVDEEQRFGVAHKERLKKMRAHVDVLTMTATPIPRTLEMALTGIRDMSTIDTPPEDRRPVLTYVGPYDEGLALGAVRRELLREGQVFWVHNRVATIDRQAAWLQEELPDARVVVAHGQMDEDDLEKQMMKFWDREADVLVCSVIIESGLDVPNANTLIVDSAHLLGLAQMYQLRGRVGRSTERAFGYFFFPPSRELTEEAHERLATISKHQSLGSGFQIALRDLEIRGAGNLLGAEQHGHIASVGFDTYCRILAESVAEMKGEPLPEEKELRIDLPVKAFIPPGWVAQEALRLDLYRRISTAGDHATLAARPGRDDRPLRRVAARGRDVVRGRVAPRERGCARGRGDHHVPRAGPHPAGPVGRRAAVRPDRARVRRHVPRGEADAEPRARAGVRRGHGPVRGAVAPGGGRIEPGGAQLRRRRARNRAFRGLSARLVARDSPFPSPFRRAHALLCLALLASCGSSAAPAATLGGVEVTDAQLAHEEDVFGFLAGLNQQPCGTGRGRRDRRGRLRAVRAHEPDPGAFRVGLRGGERHQGDRRPGREHGLAAGRQPREEGGRRPAEGSRSDARRPSDLAHRILLFGAVQTAVADRRLVGGRPPQAVRGQPHQLHHRAGGPHPREDQGRGRRRLRAGHRAGRHRAGLPGPREGGLDRPVRQAELRQPGIGRGLHVRAGVRGGRDRAGARRDLRSPSRREFGWHVIRLVEKEVQSFEDVKQQLLDASASTVFNDWLTEQVSGGVVDVNPKYGRFDEETLQVLRISSTSTDTATPSAPAGPSA